MLTNPFDSLAAITARGEQADPLVMYLVVRSQWLSSAGRLLAAAAAATVAADRAFRADPLFASDMTAWHEGSFRKVTLRAKEGEFARLLADYPHALGLDPVLAAPLVAALPARRKSTADPFLRHLQALSRPLSELKFEAVSPSGEPAALVALNPELAMSSGKAAAQVAHAALMAVDAPEHLGAGSDWTEVLAAWEAAGCPIEMVTASPVGWAAGLAELPCVAVTDSGLTEVTPGSRTVLLVRPGNISARRAARALLAQ